MIRANAWLTTAALLISAGAVVGLAGSSCTTAQALTATAESVATLGDTFAAVGDMMASAHDLGVLPADKWAAWCGFAKRFKVVFGPAKTLLEAAIDAADQQAAVAASDTLSGLKAELHVFEADLVRLPVDGGLP